ncbi:MAG: PTS sugar transporter subunit IIB [Pelolinea sp.]|jgi:PTS system cellobiose-specific IIB component|nr:PTS sugar transporter subunit IIB [Pelolinea sp.]
MKILLVCAGGASTSILMKKMKTYAEEKGFELEIVAKGMNDYDEIGPQFDMILLGPQISYKQQEIKDISQKPVAVIAPYDYAVGNVDNIFKQINAIFPKK